MMEHFKCFRRPIYLLHAPLHPKHSPLAKPPRPAEPSAKSNTSTHRIEVHQAGPIEKLESSIPALR